jgi:hypothetical protein
MGNIRKILFCALAAAFCETAPAHADDYCQLKMVGAMDIITGSDGRLLVPVAIEGQPVYFRLDIGSPNTGLLASWVEGANLQTRPIPGGVHVHMEGQNIEREVVANLSLGKATGYERMALLPSLIKSDPREMGILGADVLRLFDVELDLAHGKLNVFSTDHCPKQVVYWTHTAPVAALPIETPGYADFSVVMQLDGKDMETKFSTVFSHALLSTRAASENFGLPVPDDVLRADVKPYSPGFKALTVDGLTIANPIVYPLLDKTKHGCTGHAFQSFFGRCFGVPDLYIGLNELSKLRIFFDFSENMLFATAADAH